MSDISKIKLPNGEEYNFKDSEVRHMMDVLLGKVKQENEDSEKVIDNIQY